MVDKRCGFYQTESFRAEVGVSNDLRFDDLEQDTGWAVGWPDDDATTGIWERGDPIGTGVQPDGDVTPDGSRMCWFTGQGSPGGGAGENDVDGGHTTLLAPPVALGGADARIGYWRWYSNNTGSDPGTDVFRVQITDDGVNWVDVETVGPDGPETGGGWIYHEFTVSQFVAVVRQRADALHRLRRGRWFAGGGCGGRAPRVPLPLWPEPARPISTSPAPAPAACRFAAGTCRSGHAAMLDIVDATPNGLAVLLAGGIWGPTPFKGGTLVPVPWFLASQLCARRGRLAQHRSYPGGAGPFTLILQVGLHRRSPGLSVWASPTPWK